MKMYMDLVEGSLVIMYALIRSAFKGLRMFPIVVQSIISNMQMAPVKRSV